MALAGKKDNRDYRVYTVMGDGELAEGSVSVSYTHLQNNLASNVEAVKISAEPGTAMLSVLPIHHAFCLVMDWLKGFSQGATICICLLYTSYS